MSDIFGNIKNYTRNPLSVLALFIVMLYGIASLFFGLSSNLFDNGQKWTLLIFLIIFPVIVFGGFYRLVTKHHSKLYSPMDFKSDDSFLKTLGKTQQIEKLDKEVSSFIEEQRIEPPKEEIKTELKTDKIKTSIILSEDLVFRELETEYGVTIRRHVGESVDYGFDGHFLYNNMEVLVEIKYTEKGNWKIIAEHLRPQIQYLEKKKFALQPYLLVVIVTNNLTEKELEKGKDVIVSSLNHSEIKVKAKGFRIEELKSKYGINE